MLASYQKTICYGCRTILTSGDLGRKDQERPSSSRRPTVNPEEKVRAVLQVYSVYLGFLAISRFAEVMCYRCQLLKQSDLVKFP